MQMTETDRSAVGYTVKTCGNEQMVRGVSLRRKKKEEESSQKAENAEVKVQKKDSYFISSCCCGVPDW